MDIPECPANILFVAILKTLWNQGWGKEGCEWLRMNAVGEEEGGPPSDPTLSAAGLLGTNEAALWAFLERFKGRSTIGNSFRYSPSQEQNLRVGRKSTTWWAPKFEGSVPRPGVKVRTNFERATKFATTTGVLWKPKPRRGEIKELTKAEKEALFKFGLHHVVVDYASDKISHGRCMLVNGTIACWLSLNSTTNVMQQRIC